MILATARPASSGETRDGSENHAGPSTDARRSTPLSSSSPPPARRRLRALICVSNSSRNVSSPRAPPRRIQVDLIAHALEIAAARSVHDQRIGAPGEQVAEELGPPVEATRVSAQQPFHPGDPIGLRRLDHPMKRIRPEDRGMNLPARLGANLAQHLDEALAIRSIP